MYDIESLYQAKDVPDAIAALVRQPDAVVISGGSDVLIKIREGKLAGGHLVSIHGISELKGVRLCEDGAIEIGAATSFSHIANDPLIRKYVPVLGEAVDQVGGPQIRNIGTIGGNVCNGVTSADSASTLFTLNAVLGLAGADGVREVPIHEFYTGPGKTVRRHDEILTAIRIAKKDYEDFYGHYIKYGKRNAMEIATLGCAVHVKLTEDKARVEELRIAYGVAAPTPIRCPRTEEMAKGMEVSAELVRVVGKSVLDEVNPRSSWRASKEFRLQLVEEMAKRALAEAIRRAGGTIGKNGLEKGCLKVQEECRKSEAGVRFMLKLLHMVVNGKEVEVAIDERESLLDTLRNRLNLTSVKKGCEVGECGACTVLVDGEAVDSCIYLAAWAEGRHILTVEGLKDKNGELSYIQKAFIEEAAVQCGFCTPGLILTAVEIVGTGKRYDRDELRKLISGHLCRCTGYENILNAMERIVEETFRVVGKEE